MPNALSKFRSNKFRLVVYPVAIIALGALVYIGWICKPDPQIGARLSSAEMYAQTGAYEKAAEQLAYVFKEDPKNRHGWLVQGLIDERTGEYERAIESYRAALAQTSEADVARDIRMSIADLYRRLDEPLQSERELLALEKDSGEDAAIFRMRGLLAWNAKELANARSHFKKAKALDQDNSEFDAHIAGTYIDERRFEDAKQALNQIPADVSAAWPYWQMLARSLMKAGNDVEAKEALTKYVQLDRYGKGRLLKDDFWNDQVGQLGIDEFLGS